MRSSGSTAQLNAQGMRKDSAPVGLLSLLFGLSSALIDGHEVTEHDGRRQQRLQHA